MLLQLVAFILVYYVYFLFFYISFKREQQQRPLLYQLTKEQRMHCFALALVVVVSVAKQFNNRAAMQLYKCVWVWLSACVYFRKLITSFKAKLAALVMLLLFCCCCCFVIAAAAASSNSYWLLLVLSACFCL